MKRFYPNSLPSFPNEPLPTKFEIKKISSSVGEGVVTLRSFKKGDTVCAFTGYLVNFITQFSLTLGENLHIHDPYFMGKILHSCDPNTHCDMSRRVFIAKRDIKAGEIITMDYAQTEPKLYKPFDCSCGAPNCRGFVNGYLEQQLAEHFL
ncbi:MAG: SET domain-containing protein-lysine N-methyltransferase [Candidatus Omnitrophota bacterium]